MSFPPPAVRTRSLGPRLGLVWRVVCILCRRGWQRVRGKPDPRVRVDRAIVRLSERRDRLRRRALALRAGARFDSGSDSGSVEDLAQRAYDALVILDERVEALRAHRRALERSTDTAALRRWYSGRRASDDEVFALVSRVAGPDDLLLLGTGPGAPAD